MTEAELQAIDARLVAATPGPWTGGDLRTPRTRPTDVGQVCAIGPVHLVRWSEQREAQRKADRDADLIDHAPTDIAALLGEVRRLRALVARHAGNAVIAAQRAASPVGAVMTDDKAKGLTVLPITFREAKAYISATHRHLTRGLQGWLFGVQILLDGRRVGVAAAARPSARLLQDGRTIEIVRVAVEAGCANACSFAYGALRRAAVALGYTRVITYTLPTESGASLRAAGFICLGTSAGGEWSRPGRKRKAAEQPTPKVRWQWLRP